MVNKTDWGNAWRQKVNYRYNTEKDIDVQLKDNNVKVGFINSKKTDYLLRTGKAKAVVHMSLPQPGSAPASISSK